MGRKNAVNQYKASSSLVLSGGLQTLAESKSFHGLLVLAAARDWKYDVRGQMRVSLGELHRLTNHACETWQEYLELLRGIRDRVRLDWEHLSHSVGGFNRRGDTPILSEVSAEMDLSGQFKELVFRIPADLVEDVFKPKWYGQINPEILFSIRSNYAFNAYLYAALVVIEKDTTKDEFWSEARPISEWAEILGANPELPGWRFRNEIFRRTEKQIEKATRNTDQPIEIEFTDARCRRGLYQMRVKRIRRLKVAKKSQREQFSEAQEAQRAAEARAIEEENERLAEWVEAHPESEKIKAALRQKFGDESVTYFALCGVGYDPEE